MSGVRSVAASAVYRLMGKMRQHFRDPVQIEVRGRKKCMKFRALVADDEYMIRQGIIRFLNRYEEFEVVAEAEDGEMALELSRKTAVDVYFVDINMPFLNGLQFIEKLKEISPRALVVIITGYDSFEYAREALKLGAFEYLLKPVMEDSFDEMITRVSEQLERERNENKYLEWAKNTLLQNRGYLAANFLQKALEGHFTEEETRERARYLGMELPEKFAVTAVRLEHQKTADVKGEWTDDLLFFVAQNVANEIFNAGDSVGSFENGYGDLVVLSRQSSEAEGQLEHYRSLMENYAPVKCIMVQRMGEGLLRLPEVYQEAVARLAEIVGVSSVIKEVKAYVEQNYWREDFSLQDAADYVNLSVQYMSLLFRKEMGVTFVDYLTSVRIRKSIDLFQDEELKIYEIAERVGYATQHYFSNVFKKNLGVSPAEYRRKMKEN